MLNQFKMKEVVTHTQLGTMTDHFSWLCRPSTHFHSLFSLFFCQFLISYLLESVVHGVGLVWLTSWWCLLVIMLLLLPFRKISKCFLHHFSDEHSVCHNCRWRCCGWSGFTSKNLNLRGIITTLLMMNAGLHVWVYSPTKTIIMSLPMWK